jgi:hypothetical protein
MSIIKKNNKKHFLYIVFLTLFFVSGKWIFSSYFYSDEELLNKIIFEVKDKDYLTWVLNLSNLDFKPSYDSSYTPSGYLPIPYATLIYHSFFYKFLGLYSFILLEFFSTFIFLTIIYLIFQEFNLPKSFSLLIASFFFTFPILIEYISYIYQLEFITGSEPFFNLVFPRRMIGHIYFFIFIFLLVKLTIENYFENKYIIILGFLFSMMFIGFYFHFCLSALALFLNLFLKDFNNSNYNITKKIILFSKISFVAFIFSIPFVLILNNTEPDFVQRMGLIELNYPNKIIILNHFLNGFFSIKFSIIFFTILTLFLYLRINSNNNSLKDKIDIIFIIFLSSIFSPLIFILLSPAGSEMQNFSSLIVSISLLALIIFSIIFLYSLFPKVFNKDLLINIPLIIVIIFLYNFQNYLKINTKSDYRNDFNKITKLINNQNLNSNNNYELLTFNKDFYIWWILSGNKNLTIQNGASVSSSSNQLEDNLIRVFKLLELNESDLLSFLENKKQGWRYNNKMVGFLSSYKYQANSLTTFNNSLDFSSNIIKDLSNSSPLMTQQLLIPNSEFKRLSFKFNNFTKKLKKPNIIIIEKQNDFADIIKSIPQNYCKKDENNSFYILSFSDNKSVCSSNT